jgi:hypothetical protein
LLAVAVQIFMRVIFTIFGACFGIAGISMLILGASHITAETRVTFHAAVLTVSGAGNCLVGWWALRQGRKTASNPVSPR